MRVGHGWDLHRLVAGRPFRLGGLTIPHSRGSLGHSDGDVLLHALMDALLGAAGFGDIGLHFPDTDARWKDADSSVLCDQVLEKVNRAGFTPVNADVTVIAQEPKLSPYRDALRDSVARHLNLHPKYVNIKAKTTEGLGDIGAGLAVACHAVVLLEEIPKEGPGFGP